MKIKILKNEFLEVLNKTQGIVEKKNVMPILANILLEAKEGKPFIQVSATDLEVAVHVMAQAEIVEPGSITVNAKHLFDIIRESSSEEITLQTTDKERIEIFSNQSQYKILGLPAKEFPSLPDITGSFVRLPSEDFRAMLSKVAFAMSTDETRYHLNGVLLEKAEKGVNLVATDGHRLSFCTREIDFGKVKQDRIILPRKGVNELSKLIANEKSFELAIGDRHIFVRTEKQTLFIRLIDGNFPDYRRVIPEGNPFSVEIPKDDLVGALKRVSLLSNDRSKGVSLYFCKDSLSVISSNPEVGEAKEDLEISYNGDPLNIGFNAKYFLDVLGVIDAENVKLAFKDELSPCLLLNANDTGFKSVIMPMRM